MRRQGQAHGVFNKPGTIGINNSQKQVDKRRREGNSDDKRFHCILHKCCKRGLIEPPFLLKNKGLIVGQGQFLQCGDDGVDGEKHNALQHHTSTKKPTNELHTA